MVEGGSWMVGCVIFNLPSWIFVMNVQINRL